MHKVGCTDAASMEVSANPCNELELIEMIIKKNYSSIMKRENFFFCLKYVISESTRFIPDRTYIPQ